jgi:hypothetical protein
MHTLFVQDHPTVTWQSTQPGLSVSQASPDSTIPLPQTDGGASSGRTTSDAQAAAASPDTTQATTTPTRRIERVSRPTHARCVTQQFFTVTFRESLDLALRLAFFAAAPFLLVFAAALFPITGALVQVGLGLAAFFAGEALRRLSTRSRLVGWALGSQLAFEAYYREHPPRPFLYYVFYPLLFPYWIAVESARREFLLYKGYTLASFAMLLASLGFQYWRSFPPELGARDFVAIAAGTFLVETTVVLMFLMPIVTTVVHLHRRRWSWRLATVLVVGFASVTAAVMRIEQRRDPIVSFATRIRVRDRTEARPQVAQQAQGHALWTAWKLLPKEKGDVDRDGKIEGGVLDAAHEALMPFYRNDEAHAFDLWYMRKGKAVLLVLYFEARHGKPPIWLGMNEKGAYIHDDRALPRGAFNAMWRATQ